MKEKKWEKKVQVDTYTKYESTYNNTGGKEENLALELLVTATNGNILLSRPLVFEGTPNSVHDLGKTSNATTQMINKKTQRTSFTD